MRISEIETALNVFKSEGYIIIPTIKVLKGKEPGEQILYLRAGNVDGSSVEVRVSNHGDRDILVRTNKR